MKKVLKNKKGFTLVELLAVIVILALIMGIAVVAMSGVISSSQQNTARRTAANIISGVRQKLTLNGNLKSGTYYFDKSILERGGVTSPLGGDYVYATGAVDGETTGVETGIYKHVDTEAKPAPTTCTAASTSYVKIVVPTDGSAASYTICLASGAGNDFVYGLESDILADKDEVIIPAAETAPRSE